MIANQAALHQVQTEPVNGQFYRYIRKKYATMPLSMHGAFNEGRRYNVAGLFGALYLAFDCATCEAEVSQGIIAGLEMKKGAFVVWEYQVSLQSVVRLDSESVLQAIEVSRADITVKGNHWTASGIGEPLYNRGVEGLVAPSAQQEDGKCLDIFLDHVNENSSVEPSAQLGTWP